MERARQLEEQWERMSIQEKQLRKSGYRYIAGVDEVGRGPIAGPVVAAAVILPENFFLAGLNDSKKIAPSLRESYYEVITSQALAYTVAFSYPEEIDQLNIYQATMKVMRACVTELSIQPDICLVDGLEVKEFPTPQLALVGGDGLSVSIAAASIVAKVTRDRWMTAAAAQYPYYGFDRNAGYGTSEHLAAIAQYGPCPLHRKSFGGVKEWVD
jgi:ribonuclease HII